VADLHSFAVTKPPSRCHDRLPALATTMPAVTSTKLARTEAVIGSPSSAAARDCWTHASTAAGIGVAAAHDDADALAGG